VAAIGMAATVLLLAAIWRAEFLGGSRLSAEAPRTRIHRPLLVKTVVVVAGLGAAFVAGVRPSLAALVAGALLLPSRRVATRKMYHEVDWTLLMMFAALFVVVGGVERTLVPHLGVVRMGEPVTLAVVTAVLSNLVSNVPAVLVLKPFVATPQAWLVVAMASTLAGNFTVLGSMANLIVIQKARAGGVEIGFWTYFKVGAPLAVLTIAAGLLLLGR
jgi:Na+/H+ antiporter NhaD/arsenite permease-like protein